MWAYNFNWTWVRWALTKSKRLAESTILRKGEPLQTMNGRSGLLLIPKGVDTERKNRGGKEIRTREQQRNQSPGHLQGSSVNK